MSYPTHPMKIIDGKNDKASANNNDNEQASMTAAQRNAAEKDHYSITELLNRKGYSKEDFNYLKRHFGSEKKAISALESIETHVLDKIISDRKKKEQAIAENLKNNDSVKWLKRRFSSQEITLLKKYYYINDDKKLKARIENISDYDMDKLLNKLKQPYSPDPEDTPAYSGASSDTDDSVGLAETESANESSSLFNSNSDNDFSQPEIELLKQHFHVRNEYEALAMADTLDDYELDRILDWQKLKVYGPDVPDIFQTSKGDKYFKNDPKYNALSNDEGIADIFYGIDADLKSDDGEEDLLKNGSIAPLNVGYKGCALVSTVMAIDGLNGYRGTFGTYYDNVKEAAEFALNGKYKTDSGTDISKFSVDFAQSKGLDAYHTEDLNEVMKALQNGAVVVASVNNEVDDDMFTTGNGHIVTLTGINDDGTIHVNNPNKTGYKAFTSGIDNFTYEQIDSHKNNGFVIIERPLYP